VVIRVYIVRLPASALCPDAANQAQQQQQQQLQLCSSAVVIISGVRSRGFHAPPPP